VSDLIRCEEHGEQRATFACVHILESLRDGEPRGFLWSFDDGDHQAVCDACRAIPDAEWEATAGNTIRLICFGCFKRAAAINGVAVEFRH
jgi:hypothetical protein